MYDSQFSEPLVVLDSYNSFSSYKMIEGIDVLYSISNPQRYRAGKVRLAGDGFWT